LLYNKWGGAPTTRFLWLPDANPNVKMQNRRANVERIAQCQLPSISEQKADAARAHDAYDAAVAIVRDKARDRTKLVYAENKSYGFERNLFAMRNIGRTVVVTAAITVAALLTSEIWVRQIWNPLNLIIALVALFVLVAFWQFLPSETRVHEAGNIYAEALLDSLANL